jgi:hypothetical protein
MALLASMALSKLSKVSERIASRKVCVRNHLFASEWGKQRELLCPIVRDSDGLCGGIRHGESRLCNLVDFIFR